jgi:hypothetical protein
MRNGASEVWSFGSSRNDVSMCDNRNQRMPNLARASRLCDRMQSAVVYAAAVALDCFLLASHSLAGDFLMRRSFILAGIATAMLAGAFAAANAQQPIQRVQVGVLECRGGASIGFIVGSVTNLGCVLRVDGMPEDRYIATIRKVGVDLGITRSRRWPGASMLQSPGLGPAISPAIMPVHRAARRSASASAAMCWSAAPTIRSRCSRSACRARSASMSPPDWKASNCGRDGNWPFSSRGRRTPS